MFTTPFDKIQRPVVTAEHASLRRLCAAIDASMFHVDVEAFLRFHGLDHSRETIMRESILLRNVLAQQWFEEETTEADATIIDNCAVDETTLPNVRRNFADIAATICV